MLRTISFHRQEPHKKEATETTETACPLLGYKSPETETKTAAGANAAILNSVTENSP
jgi:hypothetical protein